VLSTIARIAPTKDFTDQDVLNVATEKIHLLGYAGDFSVTTDVVNGGVQASRWAEAAANARQ